MAQGRTGAQIASCMPHTWAAGSNGQHSTAAHTETGERMWRHDGAASRRSNQITVCAGPSARKPLNSGNLLPASKPQALYGCHPQVHRRSPLSLNPPQNTQEPRETKPAPAAAPPPHLLVKLLVDHALCELPERGRRVAAQHLSAGGHLLLAHQVALVVALLHTETSCQTEWTSQSGRVNITTDSS